MSHKVRKHIVITKHGLSGIHNRRSDIRGAMIHALSAEEDREAADRRARVQTSASSMTERCVLKTWLQMKVRAVLRYEWIRGRVWKMKIDLGTLPHPHLPSFTE
ncbi:hypothetical protein AVEN_98209-1 [Araneus ventricosus]|uniref:Uncharacterized protein n=1 Tax=Araneus ventricosus TaxID=182803 RepID=A0A4Y2LE70_ARAVE|nr:hypothetical protein AVEN_98209-1 [Araneus ventricosus]